MVKSSQEGRRVQRRGGRGEERGLVGLCACGQISSHSLQSSFRNCDWCKTCMEAA